MKTIDELIEDLSWNSADKVRDKAVDELVKRISQEELPKLLQPLDKSYWEYSAVVLKKLGYPFIEPIVPQMLEWLQDINWPGAVVIAELIVEVGEPLIPHIKQILLSNDDLWVSWTLVYVVSKWENSLINVLRDELVIVSERWDLEGAAIGAIKILCRVDQSVARRIMHYKTLLATEWLNEVKNLEEKS